MEIYRVGSNWLSCWSCPCTTKHWCLMRSNCNLAAHLSLCDGLVHLVHPNVKFFFCQLFLRAFAKTKAYRVGFNSLKHKHLIHYWSRKKIRLILEAADTFHNIKLGRIWPTLKVNPHLLTIVCDDGWTVSLNSEAPWDAADSWVRMLYRGMFPWLKSLLPVVKNSIQE
jgi:hypothetical protein